MSQIWKFPLKSFEDSADMPYGTQIISAQYQGDDLTLWGIVPDINAPKVTRKFIIAGTGWELPAVGRFIATVQAGWLVWHVFEAAE